MRRAGSDYEFISANPDQVEADTIAAYIDVFGKVPTPGSPDMLFCKWATALRLQDRVAINAAGNSNLISRAEGADLDALAEMFFVKSRPEATAATVEMRFTISAAQSSVVIIPAGTRVSTSAQDVYFAVIEDAQINIGSTRVDCECQCVTPGIIGNGFAEGTITTCVDLFPYYASCINLTISDGGSDSPTDDEFYELLLNSLDAYNTCGSRNAYKYYAKSVSSDISDVRVRSNNTTVYIYASMKDGTPAPQVVRNLIRAACDDDNVKPVTDYIMVLPPDSVSYNIELTYYLRADATLSTTEIEALVNEAVEDYRLWQQGSIGRDIDPSELIYRVKTVPGVKRVVLTAPEFVSLRTGEEELYLGNTPQLAQVNTISVTNGGIEDE